MAAPIPPDLELGPNVEIDADEIEAGPGCRIGFSGADDFRTPPGVRIRARRLVLGAGVRVGRAVRIEGGDLQLDDGVRVARHATINVVDRLHIGAGGTVGEGCEISGRDVAIGQELWMLPGAKIGGGSAFERASRLEAGHFLHLGVQTFINTARPVVIGNEVGLGTRTSIYTHGAYPSRLMGFPVAFDGVEIGDHAWLPGAIVNPGVRIGRNSVIGVNSLVTTDVPDGALAAGSPARVIRENAYPRVLAGDALREFFVEFLGGYAALLGADAEAVSADDRVELRVGDTRYVGMLGGAAPPDADERTILIGDGAAASGDHVTALDTAARRARGAADATSERLTNELRRYGIRFYSRPRDGRYVDWGEPAPFVLPDDR
jgi:acetyltransferase-like isoleucine patch superfamily enzyme